jgi:hypothetical protein
VRPSQTSVGSSARQHMGISSSPIQQWLEEGPCESVINGDISGLDKGRRDLLVGSSCGGTAKPTEHASGAKQSLGPSCSIRIWKTPGKRVMDSAYQSNEIRNRQREQAITVTDLIDHYIATAQRYQLHRVNSPAINHIRRSQVTEPLALVPFRSREKTRS